MKPRAFLAPAVAAVSLASAIALAYAQTGKTTPSDSTGVVWQAPPPGDAGQHRRADFGVAPPGVDARHLARWIAATNDHADIEFVIVDKKLAAMHVFDAQARLRATTAVLIGSARGDDSVPGIGTRPIAQVLPEERTTPAGRFVAERGRNAQGEDVVWVDYDAAVSMHRVRTGNASERRAERLATPSIDDNRISYGCINVPVAFYETHIRPLFAQGTAVVYVLPDVRPVQQVFGSHEVVAPPPDLHARHSEPRAAAAWRLPQPSIPRVP